MPEGTGVVEKEHSRPSRTGRLGQAQHRAVFRRRRAAGTTSQRAYAAEVNVPRTTLQYWLRRAGPEGVEPELAAFLETPAGVVLLHRLTLAAHLVVCWLGAGGIHLVCQFFELAGLTPFVAASYGSQQKIAVEIQENLHAYEEVERPRLAAQMTTQEITAAEDETFLAEGICLVAVEPESGFLLVEEYAENREATTWKAALDRATADLPVKVVQIASDEGKALLAHADALDAHHSPDLFHVQHAISGPLGLAMRAREAQAHAVETLEKEIERHRQDQAAWRATRHGPGRPPDFDKRIQQAEQLLAVARARRAEAPPPLGDWRVPLRAVSQVYHPFDLETGAPRSAAQVATDLQSAFDALRAIARQDGVAASALAGIEKAARVAPAMRATMAWFEARVDEHVEALELSAEEERLFRTVLLPAAYLRCAGPKLPRAGQRARVAATADRLEEGARDLAAPLRARLGDAARRCARLFQRSSSCVEGRNGRLSQYQHALRRLAPRRQEALTVVHNYLITRPDGTTAAERFFGTPPASLVAWLQDHVSLPARPAASRPRRENQRRVGGSE